MSRLDQATLARYGAFTPTLGRWIVYLPGFANNGDITSEALRLVWQHYANVLVVTYPAKRFNASAIIVQVLEFLKEREATEIVIIGPSMGSALGAELAAMAQDEPTITSVKIIAEPGFLKAANIALPLWSRRLCYGPFARHWFQALLRRIFNRLDPLEYENGPNDWVARHEKSMASLSGRARRAQMAYLASLPSGLTKMPKVSTVYVLCRQKHGSDGLVRQDAVVDWIDIFPDTKVIHGSELRHATFVEQPAAWANTFQSCLR